MDTVTRSYKFKLYPTVEQEKTLNAWQEYCCQAYNWCVTCRNRLDVLWRTLSDESKNALPKELYTQPRQYGLVKYITRLRDTIYTDWKTVPAHVMYASSVNRLDTAWKIVMEARKRGGYEKLPQLHKKEHPREMGLTFPKGIKSFTSIGRFGYVIINDATKIGALRIRMHRRLPPNEKYQTAHIKREADGWYISIVCNIPMEIAKAPKHDAIGVDLNIKHDGNVQHTVAVSDGRKYSQTNHLKMSLARLRRLQRRLSTKRKTNGKALPASPASKRTARRKNQLANLHQRITRQRAHQQRFIAKRLVDTAETVVFEDVCWSNLGRDKGRRGRAINRALKTASPGQQRLFTKQYAEKKIGRTVQEVPAKNTTQTCHKCGVISPTKLGLDVRYWTCTNCGASHDRDTNAAINIVNRRCSTVDAREAIGRVRGAKPVRRKEPRRANGPSGEKTPEISNRDSSRDEATPQKTVVTRTDCNAINPSTTAIKPQNGVPFQMTLDFDAI